MHSVRRLNKRNDGGTRKFRFYNFSERIAAADEHVAFATRGGWKTINEDSLEEGECRFGKQLRWIKDHENSTDDFKMFFKAVVAKVQTLPQLVHHSDFIVDTIVEHIQNPKSMAFESLLDLIVVLSADLREDFVKKYFPKILEALTTLLDPKEPEKASKVFQCLAQLFKYLSKWLVKDLSEVRDYYAILLGHRKQYIRSFAAESFAFLLRKLTAKASSKHIKSLTKALDKRHVDGMHPGTKIAKDNSALVSGIAALLYETLRGVSGRLHSKIPLLLPAVFSSWTDSSVDQDGKYVGSCHNLSYQMTVELMEKLAEYTRAEYAYDIWTVFASEMHRVLEAWKQTPQGDECGNEISEVRALQWTRMLRLVRLWTLHRHGSRLGKGGPRVVIEILEKVFDDSVYLHISCNDIAREASLHLLGSLWISLECQQSQTKTSKMQLKALAMKACALPAKYSFTFVLHRCVMKLLQVGDDVRRYLSQTVWCNAWLDPLMSNLKIVVLQREGGVRKILPFLLELLKKIDLSTLAASGDIDDVLSISPRGRLRCGVLSELVTDALRNKCDHVMGGNNRPNKKSKKKRNRGKENVSSTDISNAVKSDNIATSLAFAIVSPSQVSVDVLWASLRIINQLELKTKEIQLINDTISIQIEVIDMTTQDRILLKSQMAISKSKALIHVASNSQITLITEQLLAIKENPTDVMVLQSVSKVLSLITKNGVDPIDLNVVLNSSDTSTDRALDTETLIQLLKPNFTSPHHINRVTALRIIACIEPLHFATTYAGTHESAASKSITVDSAFSGPCTLVHNLLQLEETGASLTIERDYMVFLEDISTMIKSKLLPIPYVELLSNSLIGLFYIKFSPLWKVASSVIAVLASNHFNIMWPSFYQYLQIACSTYDDYRNNNSKNNYNNTDRSTYNDTSMEDNDTHHDALRMLYNEILQSKIIIKGYSIDEIRKHTDADTFHATIWGCLTSFSKTAEAKNADLVRLFLLFLRDDYYGNSHQSDPDSTSFSVSDIIPPKQQELLQQRISLPSKSTSRRLNSFLMVFKSFTNSKGLFAMDTLQSIWIKLLSKSDSALQSLALDCLLNLKLEWLTPYSEKLHDLTDDNKFREAMLSFPLEVDSGSIQKSHRHLLLPVMSRILYGKMVRRFGKHSKDTLHARRNAILLYWSSASPDEMMHMFELILQSFAQFDGSLNVDFKQEPVSIEQVDQLVSTMNVQSVSVSRQVGFLKLLTDVCSKMGARAQSLLHLPLAALARCLNHAVEELGRISEGDDDAGNDTEDIDVEDMDLVDDAMNLEKGNAIVSNTTKSELKMIYTAAVNSLAHIVRQYPGYDFNIWMHQIFTPLEVSIDNLPMAVQGATKPHVLLKLAASMSQHVLTMNLLTSCSNLLPKVFSVLSSGVSGGLAGASAGHGVIACVFDIIEALVRSSGRSGTSDEMIVEDNINNESSESSSRSGIEIITPYLSLLLKHMALRLGRGGFAERELFIVASIAQKALEKGAIESLTADQLVKLLLPHLRRTGRNAPSTDSLKNIFKIMKHLSVSMANPSSYIPMLSSLLGPLGPSALKEVEFRVALLKVLQSLAQREDMKSWLSSSVSLVVDMNAMSTKRTDEYDYDRRFNAYDQLSKNKYFFEIANQHKFGIYPVMYQILYDIQETDRTLRKSAGLVIETIAIEAVVSNNDVGEVERADTLKISNTLLSNMVLPSIKSGLKASHDTTVRRSLLLLLRYIIQSHPSNTKFHGDLSVLIDDKDHDVDFFYSITHMQVHRQAKALVRLRSQLESISLSSIVHVLLPLNLHVLFESERVLQQQLRLECVGTIGILASHLNWSNYTNTIRMLLSQISQKPEMEKWLLRTICGIIDNFHFDLGEDDSDVAAEDEGGNKYVPVSVMDIEKNHKKLLDTMKTQPGPKKAANNEGSDENEKSIQPPKMNKVLDTLWNKLIPDLKKYLLRHEDGKQAGGRGGGTFLRSPVALALTKIALKLPARYINKLLPSVLADVCSTLKSKLQDVRDETKKTLGRIMMELGPQYLQTVIMQLRGVLVNGYQKQVLGHAVHEILEVLAPTLTPSPLTKEQITAIETSNAASALAAAKKEELGDESEHTGHPVLRAAEEALSNLPDEITQIPPLELILSDLVEIFMEDILGAVGRSKRDGSSKNSAGYKPSIPMNEMKTCKSYDAWELVASKIRFLPLAAIHQMTQPLVTKLSETEDKKTLNLVKELFRRTVTGLSKNDSVSSRHLMIYTHTLVTGALDACKAKNAEKLHQNNGKFGMDVWLSQFGSDAVKISSKRPQKVTKYETHRILPEVKLTGADRWAPRRRIAAGNSLAIADYGLLLLQSALKHKLLVASNEDHRALIDPLLFLLSKILQSMKQNETRRLTLMNLVTLNQWSLPTMSKISQQISTMCFKFMAKSGGTATDSLGQACLRTITTILRKHPAVNIKEGQLKALLLIIVEDVETPARQHATFALIKAILSRKLMLPEVYDLMSRLSKMVFTSQVDTLRSSSASCLLKFLMHYPLGPKRLEEHIAMIINNLSYPFETGRMSGLELLFSIVSKFPDALIESRADQIFLPLILRLVNDDAQSCRIKVGVILKILLSRVTVAKCAAFARYILQWFTNDKVLLRRAAAQVCGILVDARPETVVIESSSSDAGETTTTHIIDAIQDTLDVNESSLLEESVEENDEEFEMERKKLLAAGVPEEWIIPPTKKAVDSSASSKLNERPYKSCSHIETWPAVYYSLTTLEKLLTSSSSSSSSSSSTTSSSVVLSLIERKKNLLPLVTQGLNHPHAWVNLAASRFLGFYFSLLSMDHIGLYLRQTGQLFQCVQAHVSCLERQTISNRSADQIVKNIIFLSNAMQKYPDIAYSKLVAVKESSDGESGSDVDPSQEEEQKDPLQWLIHRLSYSARRGGILKKLTILKFFAAFSASRSAEVLQPFLLSMLMPTIRIAESKGSTPEVSAELESLQDFAQQLIELLENQADHEAFVSAYTGVKDHMARIRGERKRKRAVEKIVDPAAAADRKRRKNLGKKAAHKRKIDAYRKAHGGRKPKRLRKNFDIL